MRIALTLCLVLQVFFGLSQSNDISHLKVCLAEDDMVKFWEESGKVIYKWDQEKDATPMDSLLEEAKSSSQFMKNLGGESPRKANHNISVQKKKERTERENNHKTQSILAAIKNLHQRKAVGDDQLMMTLMEEYVRLSE